MTDKKFEFSALGEEEMADAIGAVFGLKKGDLTGREWFDSAAVQRFYHATDGAGDSRRLDIDTKDLWAVRELIGGAVLLDLASRGQLAQIMNFLIEKFARRWIVDAADQRNMAASRARGAAVEYEEVKKAHAAPRRKGLTAALVAYIAKMEGLSEQDAAFRMEELFGMDAESVARVARRKRQRKK
ncbi:MAG: hypothetical protein BGO13_00230 [Burkholderiales bacterium 66-5]|nr:MAG: hypothetical protein BGO13_00230 [Burkholderiales bacterium 66-5]